MGQFLNEQIKKIVREDNLYLLQSTVECFGIDVNEQLSQDLLDIVVDGDLRRVVPFLVSLDALDPAATAQRAIREDKPELLQAILFMTFNSRIEAKLARVAQENYAGASSLIQTIIDVNSRMLRPFSMPTPSREYTFRM